MPKCWFITKSGGDHNNHTRIKISWWNDLKSLTDENVDALKKGIPNLEKHLENIGQFNLTPVITN